MTGPEPRAGANVRVLPILVYGLPLGSMVLLHRWVPLAMPDGGGRSAFGAILAIIGLALCASGMMVFASNSTTILPHRAPSALVTEGPYRFTRNPMYSGLALGYVGVAVLVGSWWPLLALPLVLFAMRRLVIDREETYLRAAFGPSYDLYCSRVRRWF